ncbi:SIS domain-containing protein [Nitratireductor thuwali]|uniref:Glutamine--fructose-6-phosphate aminotransferase [isomerizing] n=1 Tax=Nitratireductor thuwali TaxID=2267699 RepID=A0ABY5MS01_9HYPH|nr:hypothetical protein NTH_03140 [Nitratireductor thuwali]
MSYRSTVARQPQSLADTISSVGAELGGVDLSPLSDGVVVVTGIGASYAAAVVVAGELQRCGRRAFAVRSDDVTRIGALADIVIGLSHRGRSVETVNALRSSSSAVRLAITNDSASPLAQVAQLHVQMNNGSDATPSSTGYTATLAAAGLVWDALQEQEAADWLPIPSIAETILSGAAAKMDRLGRLFADRRAIDCVGAGSSLGTADGASLLIREAARIPAAAFDTRHYLHGPMEAMDGSTGVVIFGNGREIELARQLSAIGCPTLLVTSDASVEDSEVMTVIRVPTCRNRIAQGIADIIAPQLLAATLSDAAGLTDTKFRYRQTDTKVPSAVNA